MMDNAATQPTLVSRPCPLCGSEDDSQIFAESNVDPSKLDAFAFASRKLPEYMHHRLVKCPVCTLVYSCPVPPPDSLAQAYEEAHFDSSEEGRCAARTYAGYLAKFVDRLPDRDGALDIGAGDGAFLKELLDLRFTRITGVEPSSAPIAAAEPDVKGLLVRDIFRAENYDPGTYSLITCFQTIEHVPGPSALARDAFSLLRPGGALFIIGHNLNSLSAKVLGMRSPIFDIEHMQLFTIKTARELLRRAGFERIEAYGTVNRYPMHYYAKLLPIPNKAAVLRMMKSSPVGKIALSAALGNLGVVGFRPKERNP
jgi:SAM-dependent methyltransferase